MKNPVPLTDFWTDPTTERQLQRWIDDALQEDAAHRDAATSPLFPAGTGRARATIVAEEEGVLCGGPAAFAAFRALDEAAVAVTAPDDGAWLPAGSTALAVEADAGALLSGERTALNVLSHLSGIATEARRWVEAVPGVTVLDTRKTLPGLRRFQKYAVRCGGATNHRGDLAEFPMIKENHRILFARRRLGREPDGSELAAMLAEVRADHAGVVQVEVEDYRSFAICLEAGVELILLDNRTPDEIRGWISRARDEGLPLAAELEASGGMTRQNAADFAASGVTRISVGALTHRVRALDFSLDVDWAES